MHAMHDLTDAYLLIGILALAAMLVGGLIFAGGAVAPVAVKVLPEDAAARFLRAFWPRYYRAGAFGGAALTLVLGVLAPNATVGVHYAALLTALAALFTIGLWLALRMIPAINAARDGADPARFARLHGVVLGVTALALLAGVAFLVALGWVLPGHYLMWMQ